MDFLIEESTSRTLTICCDRIIIEMVFSKIYTCITCMYRVLILYISLLERIYVNIEFIATCYIFVDMLTKGLDVKLFTNKRQ